MTKVPDQSSPETMQRVARQTFDRAARMFRRLPTASAATVLRLACEALTHAHERHAGDNPAERRLAARSINDAIGAVDGLAASRGKAGIL